MTRRLRLQLISINLQHLQWKQPKLSSSVCLDPVQVQGKHIINLVRAYFPPEDYSKRFSLVQSYGYRDLMDSAALLALSIPSRRSKPIIHGLPARAPTTTIARQNPLRMSHTAILCLETYKE